MKELEKKRKYQRGEELNPLGKLIKIMMIMQDKSVKELARKVGIAPCYVSLVIHGKKKNEKVLQKICHELGIAPDLSFLAINFSQKVNSSQEINQKEK